MGALAAYFKNRSHRVNKYLLFVDICNADKNFKNGVFFSFAVQNICAIINFYRLCINFYTE